MFTVVFVDSRLEIVTLPFLQKKKGSSFATEMTSLISESFS